MATRSSSCKACDARTSSHTGYCQSCKSRRHRGYRRLKEENLLLDEAGGAWWIWDSRGDVVVSGKPTKDAAIIALGGGDVEDDDVAGAAAKIVNIVTDTATLAEALYPGSGLPAFNAGVYEGTRTPIRRLTGREVVTVAGTTAGAKVLTDETWISDRFGALGARQIKRLRELTRGA